MVRALLGEGAAINQTTVRVVGVSGHSGAVVGVVGWVLGTVGWGMCGLLLLGQLGCALADVVELWLLGF